MCVRIIQLLLHVQVDNGCDINLQLLLKETACHNISPKDFEECPERSMGERVSPHHHLFDAVDLLLRWDGKDKCLFCAGSGGQLHCPDNCEGQRCQSHQVRLHDTTRSACFLLPDACVDITEMLSPYKRLCD